MSSNGSALAFNETVLDNFLIALPEACTQVRVLGDLVSEVRHDGKVAEPTRELPVGLYVVDGGLQCASTSLGFDIKRGSRLGREDSRNSVFIGDLCCAAQVCGAEIPVAVKPVENTVSLLAETAMHQYMRMLGLPTFNPFALVVGERHQYLLTPFEESIETMDTIDWKDKEFDERCAHLGTVVDTFVMIHEQMIFHRDTFFRNMATNETGDALIVDPEFTVSAKDLAETAMSADGDDSERCTDAITRLMSAEFTNACHSIDKYVYDGNVPKNDPTRLKQYKRILFEPYLRRLEDSNSRYRDLLIEVYGRMMSERRRRARQGSL